MYVRGMRGFQPGPDTSDNCGGATPCTFGDWVSMSDQCAQFLGCADPSFVKTVATLASNPAAVQPLVVLPMAAAPYAGQAAGQIANTALPALSTVASSAAGGFVQSADPTTLLMVVAAIAGAIFILPKVLR